MKKLPGSGALAGGVFWTGQRGEPRVKPQNRNRKEVFAMRVGVIGLGDMGSGLAKNLIANGHEVTGLDLSADRMEAFAGMGGTPTASVAEVGEGADAVFVMVMNGDQAKSVILGEDGLVGYMPKGAAVILTATINRPKRWTSDVRWKGREFNLSTARFPAGSPVRRAVR